MILLFVKKDWQPCVNRFNKVWVKKLLCLSVFFNLCAHAQDNSVGETDWLLEDDELVTDIEIEQKKPLGSGSSKITNSSPWWQALKTTLQQDVTRAQGSDGVERSKIQLDYQGSLYSDFYLKMQSNYRYFSRRDVQAIDKGEAYGRSKVQQFWLQYSQDQCAYTFGRQTLVWGEVDGTFAVDVLTPFDFTEQLFTDYNDLRVAQDMLLVDCYLTQKQVQFFYIPKPKTNVISHSVTNISVSESGREEFGVRLKLAYPGLDLSFMLAQLYWNMPGYIPSVNRDDFQFESQKFDFAGLSASFAKGRLLYKGDLAYKSNQIEVSSAEKNSTVELALGVEYTTLDNQKLNSGFWQVESLGSEGNDRPGIFTLGWSRQYFHDDLSMSLLGNISQQPEYQNVTLLGAYKLSDVYTFSCALSTANIEEEDKALVTGLADKAVSFSLKVEI